MSIRDEALTKASEPPRSLSVPKKRITDGNLNTDSKSVHNNEADNEY